MSFEKNVYNLIEQVIPGTDAEFSFGSLYVFDLADDKAEFLLTKLREFVLCGVQMSGRFGNEHAYDFT
jgi:hypothetical protein